MYTHCERHKGYTLGCLLCQAALIAFAYVSRQKAMYN